MTSSLPVGLLDGVLVNLSLAFAASIPEVIDAPYVLGQGLLSRYISFEDPTGARPTFGSSDRETGLDTPRTLHL